MKLQVVVGLLVVCGAASLVDCKNIRGLINQALKRDDHGHDHGPPRVPPKFFQLMILCGVDNDTRSYLVSNDTCDKVRDVQDYAFLLEIIPDDGTEPCDAKKITNLMELVADIQVVCDLAEMSVDEIDNGFTGSEILMEKFESWKNGTAAVNKCTEKEDKFDNCLAEIANCSPGPGRREMIAKLISLLGL